MSIKQIILLFISVFIIGFLFRILISKAHASCMTANCMEETSIRKHEEPYREPKPMIVDRYKANDWKNDPTVLVSRGVVSNLGENNKSVTTDKRSLEKKRAGLPAKASPQVVYVMQKPEEEVKITSWLEEE